MKRSSKNWRDYPFIKNVLNLSKRKTPNWRTDACREENTTNKLTKYKVFSALTYVWVRYLLLGMVWSKFLWFDFVIFSSEQWTCYSWPVTAWVNGDECWNVHHILMVLCGQVWSWQVWISIGLSYISRTVVKTASNWVKYCINRAIVDLMHYKTASAVFFS